MTGTEEVKTIEGHYRRQATSEVWSEVDELRAALWTACYTAKMQLDGMGKGREPSPRLQDAIAKATELLGFDPTLVRPEFDDD